MKMWYNVGIGESLVEIEKVSQGPHGTRYLTREAMRVNSSQKVKKEISLEPMRRFTLKVGFFLVLRVLSQTKVV